MKCDMADVETAPGRVDWIDTKEVNKKSRKKRPQTKANIMNEPRCRRKGGKKVEEKFPIKS